MKPKSLCLTLLLGASLSTASAATQEIALSNSPAYEEAAAELRSAKPLEYEFSKALLNDVLRYLADDAGISFFSLPDGAEGADRLVTFTINASPFLALETLATANGIALIFDKGIWYMRPANDIEMIGRTYQIRHNPHEQIASAEESTNPVAQTNAGDVANTGISLQGSSPRFTPEPSQLIEDIKSLLDLKVSGSSATLAPQASVDAFGMLPGGNGPLQTNLIAQGNSRGGDDGSENPIAKVIWNSDSNTLYIVATRQQHQWIEGYLASADRPQSLIAVEVKFFETSKDPREQFGIDWSGVLGGDGINVSASELTTEVDLNNIDDFTLPQSAVLSAADMNLRLNALIEDQEVNIVSYPRVLTLNNREVVIRSVINQPVLASSSSSSLGSGATTTSAVSYLPIGTVINILPKRMQDNEVLLNLAITVSGIIGTETIDGNPFPIASSRVFTAPLQVDSGYTVAIGGIDEAVETDKNTGVPVLRHIPLIKHAFNSKDKKTSRKNLMFFITPTIMDPRNGGLPDEPQSVVRQRPDDPARSPIRWVNGELAGGIDSLPTAVAYLERELALLEKSIAEKRENPRTGGILGDLSAASAQVLDLVEQVYFQQYPERFAELDSIAWRLKNLSGNARRLERRVVWTKIW